MAVIAGCSIAEVIDAYADFTEIVAEELLAYEQVAIQKAVVIEAVNAEILLKMNGTIECQSLPYDPFQTSSGMLGEIVVTPDAVTVRIFIHCVLSVPVQCEIYIVVEVAVQSGSKRTAVPMNWNVFSIYHSRNGRH